MSDKTKIILIYTSVAVISGIMIFGFLLLRDLENIKARGEAEANGNAIAQNVGKEKVDEILTLSENLVLTNQDGQEVSIYDLKDKVWVFTQFFAKCPRCAERNYNDLLSLYSKYKDNPDFMIVCISIDPETDNVARLKEYADVVNAETASWWFLTGERESIYSYMTDQFRFMDIRERQDPAQIAAHGKYAHDLGIAVFDKGLKMLVKKDLAFARDQKNTDMLQQFTDEIHTAIESSLNK